VRDEEHQTLMADYYPLIAKAVTGLEKSSGEARRAVYERARTALVGQLRGMIPPLSESEITRERLALEEAIRKVEAEAARRMRAEPKAEAKPPEPPRREELPPPPPAPRDGGPPSPANSSVDPPSRGDAPPPPRLARNRLFERSQLSDKGLKGFRDVVAETETLGDKTAQASKSARAAFSAVPPNAPSLDRIEPRPEPEALRGPARDMPPPRSSPAPRPEARQDSRPEPRPVPSRPEPRPSPPPRPEPRPAPSRQVPRQGAAAPLSNRSRARPPQSRKGLVAAMLTVFIIIALAATAVWQRERIAAVFGVVRSFAPQGQRDTPRPKIPDRVGQDGQTPSTETTPGKDQGSQQTAAVAQRVVLYEEDPADPAGKRYVGSAIWRTEMVTLAQGQPAELAVRCDVEIPERRIAMTFSMRRNVDQALPASHTVEIMFNLPADFPFGGINNVPGILMKEAEQTRGTPLAGLTVKVTTGFFLIGLSATDSEMQRNLQLLKERAWFDIPVVYNNGRRAILAVEKGTPGSKAFSDAFAAWKQ
jgi:hypothetical protein